jgi:hypothetical protein
MKQIFFSTVTSCFYDSDTTGQNDSGKGQARTTDQMMKENTYTGWNFAAVWNIDGLGVINSGYPFLRNN